MPHYQISLIYRSGKHGFTNTFYRPAPSAREASDLGDTHALAPFLEVCPASTVLQAIRAQEVDGLKRIFLRLVYQPGKKQGHTAETPGISAKCRVRIVGGGDRGLEVRGLADALVQRDALGNDQPGPGFDQALSRLSRRIRELNFAARQLVPHPEHQVAAYGLHPDDANLTVIHTRYPDFVPAVGSYVDFGGGGLKWLLRSRGYLVMASEPGRIAVYHPWGNVPDEVGRGRVWIRQLEYQFTPLGDLEFTGFGSRQTGPAYHPLSWTVARPWLVPISPCGRIVDFSRTSYTVDMAFFRGDPQAKTAVVWYRPQIPPGALPGQPQTVEEIPAVPYAHPFGSRHWERAGDFLPALGEVKDYVRNNGRAPVELRGIGLCGSRDAWENGVSLQEPYRPINVTTGQPCCCGPGILPVEGEGAGEGEVDMIWNSEAGGAGEGGVEQLETVSGCTSAFAAVSKWYRVTVAGATGAKAHFNGVWTMAYLTGCAWGNDPNADSDHSDYNIFMAIYDNGGPELQVLVGLTGTDAEYYLNPITDPLGVMVATKTVGGSDFPATVTAEAFIPEPE